MSARAVLPAVCWVSAGQPLQKPREQQSSSQSMQNARRGELSPTYYAPGARGRRREQGRQVGPIRDAARVEGVHGRAPKQRGRGHGRSGR